MKNLVELLLNESINNNGKGYILEVDLRGKFFWHRPEDDDFDEWNQINDWEIAKCSENTIVIKIGDIKDIKTKI